MKNPIAVVIGTRPGAIKSIPVYFELKKRNIPTVLIATFQHDDLLQQVFNVFNVVPDVNLNVMKQGQDLFYLTGIILTKIQNIFEQIQPAIVLVHGDTTTAFSASLAAFYLKIPIGHMEAGLRTGNMYAPFPEEMNRKSISHIAKYHFAPTSLNIGNLLAEGINRKHIYQTGNVVVDALLWVKEKIWTGEMPIDPVIKEQVDLCKKNNQQIVLLTAHRRESFFNNGLIRIFSTIKKFAEQHKDIFFFYPFHPNPNVLRAVEESGLQSLNNIYLCNPVKFKELIYLLSNVNWVMTDSGGIQEESISLGKRVLILRDVTERIEAVWEGFAYLVGTNERLILEGMQKFYNNPDALENPSNIYGDGNASKRIVSIIEQELRLESYKEDLPTRYIMC